jgi:hypothetical protein
MVSIRNDNAPFSDNQMYGSSPLYVSEKLDQISDDQLFLNERDLGIIIIGDFFM